LDPVRPPRGGALRQSGRKADRPPRTEPWKRREHGSRRKPKAGFHRLPHSLGNLAQPARFPLFHRSDDGGCGPEENGPSKDKGQTGTQGGGLKAASLCFTKRTDHVLIKPDNLTCYQQLFYVLFTSKLITTHAART